VKTMGFACAAANEPLAPFSFERREPRSNDVVMEILYCGVCHSDLHMARNDWGGSIYPMVPGHEIVGRVIAVGDAVSKFTPGDHGAIGCIVDSCRNCDQCRKGEEQFCREGFTVSFASPDKIAGGMTFGGFSRHIVAPEDYVCTIPDGLDLARAAPILCAGITTWVPLKVWKVGPSSRVGVVGMGGLGHLAIKLAAALGARVTMISRSPGKEGEARAAGADRFLLSMDEAAMKAAANTLDVILDTVPVQHDLDAYTPLLDIDGTLVVLGQMGPFGAVHGAPLMFGRRRIAGTAIGGMRDTQEVIDFCARKNILPECTIIRMDQVNEAFDRLAKGDIARRFVVDMASLEGV
jgi:uncharacterized zinc-type alcohol dehydrogenase-like protein